MIDTRMAAPGERPDDDEVRQPPVPPDQQPEIVADRGLLQALAA